MSQTEQMEPVSEQIEETLPSPEQQLERSKVVSLTLCGILAALIAVSVILSPSVNSTIALVFSSMAGVGGYLILLWHYSRVYTLFGRQRHGDKPALPIQCYDWYAAPWGLSAFSSLILLLVI